MGLNHPPSTGDFQTFAANSSRRVTPSPTTREFSADRPPIGPATRALVTLVRGYQLAVSPALHALAGPGCGCRFTPTCSHYAIQALAEHGALHGSALAARRLLRCQPWGGSGTDPVPTRATLTTL